MSKRQPDSVRQPPHRDENPEEQKTPTQDKKVDVVETPPDNKSTTGWKGDSASLSYLDVMAARSHTAMDVTMADVLKTKQDTNLTTVRKSLEVKSDADVVRSTSEKTMLPEAHPVEETKRDDSQEDNERPRKITETGTKVPGSDADRTLSGGNTNKSVIAHSQEEEKKVTLTSLRDSQGTTAVSTVCESNGMMNGPCRVTTKDPDVDLVESQNHMLSRKTDRVGIVSVPECHSNTVTTMHNVESLMSTGDVPPGTVTAMSERPGRQMVGGGATLSATAEAPCAELQADAAAGLLGRPGLPGPHPEGGLLRYPIN